MSIVYLSGLETDHRLFSSLIERLGGHAPIWIKPKEKETLSEYSKRMAEVISEKNSEPIHLVGLCFGGVVAMEMAQHIPVKSVATLNAPGDSADINEEFRKAVEIGSKLPLSVLKGLLSMKASSFYKEKDKLTDEQFAKLEPMLKSLDLNFLKWAAVASAGWNQPRPHQFSCPHIAIHGEQNAIIKRPKNMKTELMMGAGHLIPLTHPEALSIELEQFWKKIPDL